MIRHRPSIVLGGLGIAVLVAVTVFTGLHADVRPFGDSDRAAIDRAANVSEAFQIVAEDLRPSVVSIRAVKRIQTASSNEGIREFSNLPPEFRRFFGDDLFERFERIPREGRLQRGTGTGVIVTNDGYIVTNNHVVRDADEVMVTLHDDRSFRAEIVGTDPHTDLAVLKVDANVTPARLGNSDAMNVGEWVLAIGTPFGLDQTVTAGIVSAKGRANVGVADYEDFLQTDAAINPGNSGGPLVNLDGEVVGINTAIASRSGTYNGIGFAIPSNMVRSVMDALIRDGRVERGRIGALVQDLSDDLARSFGFEGDRGVLIGDVVPDGPADRAGLRSGDVVTRFGDEPIRDANHLRNTVAATEPGRRVTLELFRGGDRLTIDVEIGRLEGREPVAAARAEWQDELGLALRNLDSELAERLGLDADRIGVVVTGVEPDGLAARAGLRTKDIVLRANGDDVRDVDQLVERLEHLDDGVRLLIERDGIRRFVFLKRH